MSVAQPHTQRGPIRGYPRSSHRRIHYDNMPVATIGDTYDHYHHNQISGFNRSHNYTKHNPSSRDFWGYNHKSSCARPEVVPPLKKRKFSATTWENTGKPHQHPDIYNNVYPKYPMTYNNGHHHNLSWHDVSQNTNAYDASASTNKNNSDDPGTSWPWPDSAYTSSSSKRNRAEFEDDSDLVFVSRDEIDKCSPSRKDGIDATHEMRLRYSYCAFLQNLGMRLDIPQTTIGTAMVLCHRFFLRRSHASHDRFLIATAALFLAAKSEETARPLNDVLKVSCELLHKQDITLLSYVLPLDWFERYRDRTIEAEQLILTTLNFELGVQHPYDPLISTLEKVGFSQSVLVHMALNLVSEGLRSSLWLQFKPHQIAAGAAFLAAKFLNMDLASYRSVWQEFKTPPSVLKDIEQQLMELF